MFDLTRLLEGLKLPAKIFFALLLATGILLFSPKEFLDVLGLNSLINTYRPYIGAIFVVSSCICLVAASSAIGEFVWPWIAQAYLMRRGERRLRNLNSEEKAILSYYIDNQTRGQYLSIASGTVKVLEIDHILSRASNLGLPGSLNEFSYAIQPWAWEFLNKHPELLK